MGAGEARAGFAVLHQLERLARDGDKALLVVTHDFRIAQVADRVLWLEDWADGHTRYFCPDICVQKFDRAPEGHLAGRVGVRREAS